ncbi:MAG: polyprenyl synthetase family protein [Chloroflexi bacterium]|nr:polyprenyl synthetase family protein [Chloroflexota bacterium]
MNLPSVFEKYRAEIDAELKASLAARQSPLYDMMRYHLGWIDSQGDPLKDSAGKALRPTLCLLACHMAGGDFRHALPAAAAIELVHNYSLIHDDIQDDDRERRHRPTVWSLWGKPQAINTGTAMRLVASRTLSRLGKYGIPLSKQATVYEILDEATLKLLEGQYLDISYESRFDIGIPDYIRMVEGKTAALIACSLEIGALLGTDDEKTVRCLRDIGWNLGLAFQIRDDILGIWGDQGRTGKPLGSDIQHRKKTLPVAYLLEKADHSQRLQLIEVYKSETVDEDGIARVLRMLDSLDARSQSQMIAEQYYQATVRLIDQLALPSSAKQDLEEMGHFLIKRDF